MSLLESLNSWILSNQALVVSIGIPAFTLLVTAWIGFLSHRVKVAEVRLNGRIKLSEYRQENFKEMLSLSASIQMLYVEQFARRMTKVDVSGDEKNLALLQLIDASSRLLLLSRAPDGLKVHFSRLVHVCTEGVFHEKVEVDPGENLLGQLREVCKKIIDDERVKIEMELKGLA